jgi:hypothetical protein
MEVSRIPKNRASNSFPMVDCEQIAIRKRKPIPHVFVLDAIASVSPWTRPMFGCLAVYVEDKIVLVLRDKQDHAADNGVWLATTHEHHESMLREFPSMRSIQLLGKRVTGWQVLPAEASDFEQAALRACELIVARDPRIGKLPGAKRAPRKQARTKKSSSRAKKTIKSARKQSRH